jgi:cyclic nucleotide gated channel, plant
MSYRKKLMIHMTRSHQVVGAIYYLLAVDRQKTCWETQCSIADRMNKLPCDPKFLDCQYATSIQSQNWANITDVFTKCNDDSSSVSINYGILIQAMQNGVLTASFSEKYFYSMWWGLQQLTFVFNTNFIPNSLSPTLSHTIIVLYCKQCVHTIYYI